jgi:hypothetical protein
MPGLTCGSRTFGATSSAATEGRPRRSTCAKLSQALDGAPVPEELHRSRAPSWRWPASQRVEYMIALYITAGWVTGDPRYGDPATRLADIAVQRFGAAADDAVKSGLQWVDKARQRRAQRAAWWRSAIKANLDQP